MISVLNILSQLCSNMAANEERTFIMIKPDGVHRGLIGDIIKRFEQKGFKLVAMKFMHVSGFFVFIFCVKTPQVTIPEDLSEIICTW